MTEISYFANLNVSVLFKMNLKSRVGIYLLLYWWNPGVFSRYFGPARVVFWVLRLFVETLQVWGSSAVLLLSMLLQVACLFGERSFHIVSNFPKLKLRQNFGKQEVAPQLQLLRGLQLQTGSIRRPRGLWTDYFASAVFLIYRSSLLEDTQNSDVDVLFIEPWSPFAPIFLPHCK